MVKRATVEEEERGGQSLVKRGTGEEEGGGQSVVKGVAVTALLLLLLLAVGLVFSRPWGLQKWPGGKRGAKEV